MANLFVEQNAGPAAGKNAPMISMTSGQGTDGLVADLSNHVNLAAYVKRNLICIVMATPEAFDQLDNPTLWHRGMKAVLENHSKNITGINSTLSVEYAENAVSGDGNMATDVTNVTRAQSQPVHTVLERDGKPVAALWDGYILNLIGDPVNNIPRVLLGENRDKVRHLLTNEVAFTCLYIEPDRTYRKVQQAWLVTDMKPRNGTNVEGTKDTVGAGTTLEHSLEFTGYQQVGYHIDAMAQAELDKMFEAGLPNHNFQTPVVSERSAAVSEVEVGIVESVEAAAETFVQP